MPESNSNFCDESLSLQTKLNPSGPIDRRTFDPAKLPPLASGTAGALAALWAACEVQFHHFTINDHRAQQLAILLIGQPERFGKSIVYFDRQRDGELLYLLLRQAGIRAAILSPKQNLSTRCQSTRWTDLRENRIDVLIHVDHPIRTFDCPELKTVFCRPAGKTATRQMAAGVFQNPQFISAKQIVQCINTSFPIHQWVRPDKRFLWKDGSWVSVEESSPCDHPLYNRAPFAPPSVPPDRHRIGFSPVQRS